jgi:hypothetical protein
MKLLLEELALIGDQDKAFDNMVPSLFTAVVPPEPLLA